MQVGNFFVSLIFFVFVVFLFPTLNDVCVNANTTDMASVIRIFPYMLLVVVLVFPIYFGIKERK